MRRAIVRVSLSAALIATVAVLLAGCGSREIEIGEDATESTKQSVEAQQRLMQGLVGDPSAAFVFCDQEKKIAHRQGCTELANVKEPKRLMGQMAAMGGYQPCPVCMPQAAGAQR